MSVCAETAGDAATIDSLERSIIDEKNPETHADDGPSRCPEAAPHVSHYSLDFPLPFERYDHRRLGPRDIMVHRIMADLMNPHRVVARTYDADVVFPADFAPIKAQDHELGHDLQLLRKMLFTSCARDAPPPPRREPYVDSEHPFKNPPHNTARPKRSAWQPKSALQPKKLPERADDDDDDDDNRSSSSSSSSTSFCRRPAPPTQADLILDLVMRHYLEVDDMALRTWIARARPPRKPAGPSAPPSKRTDYSRARAVPELRRMIDDQAARDRKLWRSEDVAHLATLRAQTHTQHRFPLYDGGASEAPLRQRTSDGCLMVRGTRRGLDHAHWAVTTHPRPVQSMPAWPDKGAPSRFFVQPAWTHAKTNTASHPLRHPVFSRLDLTLAPSRTRPREAVWATHSSSSSSSQGGHRPTKRGTSEPPPDRFTSARLPIPDNAVGSVTLEMTFPRMTLAQLDRRSRRRSLSRSRIEEQFDWRLRRPAGESEERERDRDRDEQARPRPRPRCQNCFKTTHETQYCTSPCGHCGAPNPHAASVPLYVGMAAALSKGASLGDEDLDALLLRAPDAADDDDEFPPPLPGHHGRPHLAPACPVAPRNRCKCTPFPTFHTAARCPEPCRRCHEVATGKDDSTTSGSRPRPRPRPGAFGHQNAMTCRARCCMCGLPGHSGRECRHGRCRCGGAHLGQDCRWKPTCRAAGCARFWCGLHCRECGGVEGRPFVGWRCRGCLGGEEGGEGKGEGEGEGKKKRRNRKREREKEKEKGLDIH